MHLDRLEDVPVRGLEIELLPLAEKESEVARCVVCRVVKPIYSADWHDGEYVNATCEQCS